MPTKEQDMKSLQTKGSKTRHERWWMCGPANVKYLRERERAVKGKRRCQKSERINSRKDKGRRVASMGSAPDWRHRDIILKNVIRHSSIRTAQPFL